MFRYQYFQRIFIAEEHRAVDIGHTETRSAGKRYWALQQKEKWFQYESASALWHVRMSVTSAVSTTPIIGIAAGGTIAFLGILVTAVIYFVRRHDRIQRSKFGDVEESLTRNDDLAYIIRSRSPRGVSMSNRSSFVPYLPPHQAPDSIERPIDSIEDDPPIARVNTKRTSTQKFFFKMSGGIRDSWPLGSSMQMPDALRLQSSSTVTLNQVAPPGYIVPPDPTWLNRTKSRNSKTKVSVSQYSYAPPSPSPGPRKQIPRRAISEKHLSTILRSTSQRLKSTRRTSIARARTVANRSPGGHALEKLPPLPKPASESREILIQPQSFVSGNLLFQQYITRTPSPGKKIPKILGRANTKGKLSSSPSADSEDSLYIIDLPDFVFPSPLTSPSRRFASGSEASAVHKESASSREISARITQDDRSSVVALEPGKDLEAKNPPVPEPLETILTNDPFCSSVETAKPILPIGQINLSPRPLYIRKTTFGQVEEPQKSAKALSPLKDISGNRQTPPKIEQCQSALKASQESSPNPFQWSCQDSNQSQSPSPKQKQGHKRSKVIRISNLPRTSNVSIVHEDPEEDSSVFDAPRPSVRLVQPSLSKTPSPPADFLSCRLTVRPPSSPTFDPCVSIPKLVGGRVTDSPTLGLDMYSPTLATTNNCNKQTSGDEVFRSAGSPKRSATTTYKWRESSISPNVSPSTKLNDMISFPAEDIKDILRKPKSPALSPNSEILKSLENRKSTPPPPVLAVPPAAVLPPASVVPIPVPGHLTGPRAEPPKQASLNLLPVDSPQRCSSQKLPLRASLASSICALRRMNSEVSFCESLTSQYSNSSPVRSEPESIKQSPEVTPTRRSMRNSSRASKHYLMLGGITSSDQRRRVIKRDSSRMKSLQHIQHLPDLDSEDDFSTCDISSPASARNSLGLSSMTFPIPNGPSTPDINSKANLDKVEILDVDTTLLTKRWSNSMPKTPLKNARYESQTQIPLPKPASTKWGGMRSSNISTVATSLPATDGGKENAKSKYGDRSPAQSDGGSDGNFSPCTLPGLVSTKDNRDTPKKKVWGSHLMGHGLPRPDSMGLYDAQGFLRSSPDRGYGFKNGAGER